MLPQKDPKRLSTVKVASKTLPGLGLPNQRVSWRAANAKMRPNSSFRSATIKSWSPQYQILNLTRPQNRRRPEALLSTCHDQTGVAGPRAKATAHATEKAFECHDHPQSRLVPPIPDPDGTAFRTAPCVSLRSPIHLLCRYFSSPSAELLFKTLFLPFSPTNFVDVPSNLPNT